MASTAATQTAESLLNRIAASTRGYKPAQGLLISAIRKSYADRATPNSTSDGGLDTTAALNPFAAQSTTHATSVGSASPGGLSEAQISKAIATYKSAGVRLHADQVRALARWYCFEQNRPVQFAKLVTTPQIHALDVSVAVAREWMRGVVASYLHTPATTAQQDQQSQAPAVEGDAVGSVKAMRRKANKAAREARDPRSVLSTLASLRLLHTAHARDAAVLGTALYGLVYGPISEHARSAATAIVEQLLNEWSVHERALRGGTGEALTTDAAKRIVLDYGPLHAVLQDFTVEIPDLEAKKRSELLATISSAIARWSAVADSVTGSDGLTAGADAHGLVIDPPTSWPDYLARAGSAL